MYSFILIISSSSSAMCRDNLRCPTCNECEVNFISAFKFQPPPVPPINPHSCCVSSSSLWGAESPDFHPASHQPPPLLLLPIPVLLARCKISPFRKPEIHGILIHMSANKSANLWPDGGCFWPCHHRSCDGSGKGGRRSGWSGWCWFNAYTFRWKWRIESFNDHSYFTLVYNYN